MSDSALRKAWPVLLPLAVALVLAALLRLVGVTRSLSHDEVYTWVMFSSHPYGDILTSYHLPNNHILHTLLVRLSASLFGNAEWALRLPALAAGLLAIPVLYGFAWRLTESRNAAVWSMLLLALSGVHVSFSQQARGYTLLVLLGLVFAWALIAAVEANRDERVPVDTPWGAWVLCALAGGLAVLTVPTAILLVGAGILAAAGFIRWQVPARHRRHAQVQLFVCALVLCGLTLIVYAPLLDDVQAHAQRFGVPLSLLAFPGFVADVWMRIGPHRWPVPLALVTLFGAVWLVRSRRAHGLFLVALTGLPFLLSLALATGGAARTYVFLLPFLYVAVAVSAGEVETRLARLRPGSQWARLAAGAIVLVPLLAAYRAVDPLESTRESGYRATGRFVADSTAPGDVVVVPYIVDSAVGYYSEGATVQRVREAVAGGLRRLLFVTRPGTPRFDLPDLMLATNFTTDAGEHADTYRNWSLPGDAFRSVARFDLVDVLEPAEPIEAAPLPDLLRPDSWRLYYQSQPEATTWFPVPHPGHSQRTALQVRVVAGTASVLHSVGTFVPERDGLVLLAYCKRGDGYASLYERRGADVRALQMGRPVSATAAVSTGDDSLYTELYLRPVLRGSEYGVFITARAGDDLVLGDWAVYSVAYGGEGR